MKHSFLLALGLAFLISACTTLENRRDLYAPQKVEGPYTRMLQDGIPKPAATEGEIEVTAEQARYKR